MCAGAFKLEAAAEPPVLVGAAEAPSIDAEDDAAQDAVDDDAVADADVVTDPATVVEVIADGEVGERAAEAEGQGEGMGDAETLPAPANTPAAPGCAAANRCADEQNAPVEPGQPPVEPRQAHVEPDQDLIELGIALAITSYLEPIVHVALAIRTPSAIGLSALPFAGASIALTTTQSCGSGCEWRGDLAHLAYSLPAAALMVIGLDMILIGIIHPSAESFVLIPRASMDEVGLSARGRF